MQLPILGNPIGAKRVVELGNLRGEIDTEKLNGFVERIDGLPFFRLVVRPAGDELEGACAKIRQLQLATSRCGDHHVLHPVLVDHPGSGRLCRDEEMNPHSVRRFGCPGSDGATV